jgi:prevent-host-death family protein
MSRHGSITMKTMSAKEAKDAFGLLLDTAQREPVTITKKGREVAVLVSKTDFERLEALEDAYWGALAGEARQEGFVGREESERLLNELANAKD